MKKIISIFKPKLRLVRGTRLTSALFIGVSIALAAGILLAANIYYDIDTGKIMVEDTQQATTTQITVDTDNTTALTVTQRGAASAFLATSTSAMTSDVFQIVNLGSGNSLIVRDEDADITPFVVDASGKVGVATSTPSDTLAVEGNIISSGNIIVYGSATSTFGGGIDVQAFRMSTDASNNYSRRWLSSSLRTRKGTNLLIAACLELLLTLIRDRSDQIGFLLSTSKSCVDRVK